MGEDGSLQELFYYPFKKCCTVAAWDPLHTQLLAVAYERDLAILNISDNSVHTERHNVHSDLITCLEFNPNRPSTLCSGSRDGTVTFWHVSHNGLNVEKILQAHSHWYVWMC